MRGARSLVVVVAALTVLTLPALAGAEPRPRHLLPPLRASGAETDAPVGAVRGGRSQVGPTMPPPPLRSFTLVATGDVLPHTPIIARAQVNGAASGQSYDFRPMFARLAPTVSAADLAVCHLETPVAPPGEPLSRWPIFGVPAQITQGVASAGYDRCSFASNHTLDRGVRGIDASLAALEAQGLGHAGAARTPEEAATPRIVTVNAVRVAHLSYTFSFNGFRLPRGEEWRANLIDAQRILAEARAARALGAEYVVASLHWGNEGTHQVTAGQVGLARTLTAPLDGVDLILGHHAHWLQPIDQVNGRWVFYGLGNLLSNMGGTFRPSSEDGAVAMVTVTERPAGGFETSRPAVLPTWVQGGSFVIHPVLATLADPSTSPTLRASLLASLARTKRILGPYVPG